jgi:hypothetical protein
MVHFTQLHAVSDEAKLNLLRRAYNDFCRDAGLETRPPDAAQSQPAVGDGTMRTQSTHGHRLHSARPPTGNQVTSSSRSFAGAL